MSEKQPIGVIGVGWVGLVSAACFAELGHPVTARDIVPEKIEALQRGEVSIHEPGLEELVAKNAERLTFTTDMGELLAAARLLFVCVDTPPTYSGDADLSSVMTVVEELPDGGEHVLVMKSTVPVGTGHSIKRNLRSTSYVSCPEFLKEGTAVKDFLEPDRVVIGAQPEDQLSADAVADLYAVFGAPVVRTDLASAEMIKLASNAFLATKISFINEIANVCDELGADVTEVARGMGYDNRIGPKFLQAGVGFGGSCFDGAETLVIRYQGWPRFVSFEQLWGLAGGDAAAIGGQAIEPRNLEVWSWVPGEDEPEWMPVSVLTKRPYEGDMVEVRTKMGRRLRVTADHPFVVGDGEGAEILTRKLAEDLDPSDWLPLASGSPPGFEPKVLATVSAVEGDEVAPEQVIVRPERREIEALRRRSLDDRALILDHPRGSRARMGDINRSGALRLPEACEAEMDLKGASLGTAKNGTFVPTLLDTDERFWRVVGLYLAEGCLSLDRGRAGALRHRISWHFHPTREEHLVDEVVSYWRSQGVKATVHTVPTSRKVTVSSRILAAWWTGSLGLGRNAYTQRLPDLIWEQTHDRKRALLSGLWEGDGSWSLISGGPSVCIEFGTVSAELADGVARLLGDLRIVCSWRRGRTAKSTRETHWLRVSGASQVEDALFLVPDREQREVIESISRQQKRIAPTGYRRFGGGAPWVRIVKTERRPFNGAVYSLKAPGSQTVVTSGGLIAHQCFPKDVSALKQLAGNSGYHFQLLNSVIEVNELQKRRVVGKLRKHLGSLIGRRIALLGLSFKPDTDDMREASSLVLAARLQGEGAEVRGYDPVAERRAKDLLPSVELRDSPADALDGADAAVLVTEWPQFAELDWVQMAGRMARPLMIDGRNFLDPETMRAAGFTYEGIGRNGADRVADGVE